MYWTLDAKVKCPKCSKVKTWDLQTHFMGYMGSCAHYYKLGEKVKELENLTVKFDGIEGRRFLGDCPNCDGMFDLGAEIIKGKVENVFILKETHPILLTKTIK